MIFQFNRRWLERMTIWASVAIILTFTACGQPESEAPPQSEPGPVAEQVATPAADEVAAPAAQEAPASPAVQQEAVPGQPAAVMSEEPAAEEPDPFEVPDGTPEELLEYAQGLMALRPEGNTAEARDEFLKKMGGTLTTVGDKILPQKPTDDQAKNAVAMMIQGLSLLESSGDADAGTRLQGLPEELKKAGFSKLARMPVLLPLAGRLEQATRPGTPSDAIKSLISEVEAYFEGGPVQPEEVQLAMTAGTLAERADDPQWAAEVCTKLGSFFSSNEDEQVALMGAMLVGAGRRINLVGNEMPLEGVTLDGEALDWSKYEGKVVLVDFWATWCGPCIAEVPNIRANYDAYQERGFDVIGISVDRDREALVSFLKEHEEPWTVLCDEDLAKSETGEKMSTRYGIFGIPSMALIGTDGKVVSTSVRGPQLGQELEKLLGPVEDKKEEPPAAEAEKKDEAPAAEEKPAAE